MQVYDGVPTAPEYGEIQRLRHELSSVSVFLMFAESHAAIAEASQRYSGALSEQSLEARIDGVDARVPWTAVTAQAASSTVVVLLIGQTFLPICRSFFATEEQWQAACETVERSVPGLTASPGRWTQGRTVALSLALLAVIFLAWHFAQMPGSR